MNKDLTHHELLKDLSKGRNSYYVCINRTTHWYNNLRKIDEDKIIDKNSIVLFTEDYGGVLYPFNNYFGVTYKMSDFRNLTYEEYDYYIVKGNKKYVDNIKEEDKSSQSYTKGDIVYPTYEGVVEYSDQFSNSISGEVLRVDDYHNWHSVKWSNNKVNAYPKNCITTDFNKSVYVTHREKYRPKSKFDDNLPENIVKEIWLNVRNKIDDVLYFTNGYIAECFLFKDSKQGKSFWYEFSKHYNMSRFDECVKMFEELNKPKEETVELSDDYWINYKLKQSDLIGTLEDYPLEIAQLYYDLCVKSGKKESNILELIQKDIYYGFGWGMETKKSGVKWRVIREIKDFSSYYKNVVNPIVNESPSFEDVWGTTKTIEPDTIKTTIKEPIVKGVRYGIDPYELKEDLYSSGLPTMKRFQKKKKTKRTVSTEINVKGLRKKPKSNN